MPQGHEQLAASLSFIAAQRRFVLSVGRAVHQDYIQLGSRTALKRFHGINDVAVFHWRTSVIGGALDQCLGQVLVEFPGTFVQANQADVLSVEACHLFD